MNWIERRGWRFYAGLAMINTICVILGIMFGTTLWIIAFNAVCVVLCTVTSLWAILSEGGLPW